MNVREREEREREERDREERDQELREEREKILKTLMEEIREEREASNKRTRKEERENKIKKGMYKEFERTFPYSAVCWFYKGAGWVQEGGGVPLCP